MDPLAWNLPGVPHRGVVQRLVAMAEWRRHGASDERLGHRRGDGKLAPTDALEGDFLDGCSREAFRISQEISAYSFPALAKAARPLMKGRDGSLLTLTYLGAVHTMPNYNIMGLAKASLEASVRYLAVCLGPEGTRANAISAGPIKTLAASGIGSFGKLLAFNERNAPLRRNVTIDEVGNAAAFLCSDLASGITGEVMYVDGGFNTTALGNSEQG